MPRASPPRARRDRHAGPLATVDALRTVPAPVGARKKSTPLQRVDSQRPVHHGRTGSPVRRRVCGEVRDEARGDDELGLIGEPGRRCRACLSRYPARCMRGDEVIVPAISWATTFHPLQQYGLKLRFVDVELETLNIDVSRLEAALTPRTRMVMAVSILGNPAALDVMRAFCDRHDLILFEDNCESLGASLNGRPCGTFGDIDTFSTFFSHHISTMEGGLLVTNDTEIDHLARAIRNHGWAARPAGRLDARQATRRPVLRGLSIRAAGLQRTAARDVAAPSASNS